MCTVSGLRVLLLALGLPAAALPAAEPVPLLQPQWLVTLAQDELVYDFIAASADATSLRLSDGGAVTATVTSGEVVLRRYGADGSVQHARVLGLGPAQLEVVLRAAPAHDAFYVIAGGAQSEARLTRVDADLQPEWQVALPHEAICQGEGDCLRLEVLDDGSTVAMRAFSVVHVGADGQVRWRFVDPGASGSFRAGDLAVDDTAVWVATSGGTSFSDPTATLARLDFDGLRLSAEVSSCHGCGGVTINDIDLANGGASVVGNLGGQGFLARYDALGNRLFWAAGDQPGGYWRLDHDVGGAVYVLAVDNWERDVRRLDPASGATLWSAPADDFVARASGVATIRQTPSTVQAAALDAAGTTLWQQALTAGSWGQLHVTSHPALVGDSVELLVRDPAPSDDPCAQYPRLVRLDDMGTPSRFPLPCRTVETSASARNLDAAPAGVLVNTGRALAVYSANGDLRWRQQTCPWCGGPDASSVWLTAMLTDEGGAWAIRWQGPTLALPDGRTTLQRFAADGTLAVEVASLAEVANDYSAAWLLPGVADVVMLRGGARQTLTWQRAASDGTDLGMHTYILPDSRFNIEAAQRLPDGGTSVLVKGDGYCTVGCPPFYTTVLRLAADGALLWRYQFPEDFAPEVAAALGDDGAAAAVLPSAINGGPLRMRVIDSTGNAGADIMLTGVAPATWPRLLVSAPGSHWLLHTEAMPEPDNAYWLLDGAGQVEVERHDGPYPYFLQHSVVGYLMAEPMGEVGTGMRLLDPHTLADRAMFYRGTGDISTWRTWRILDDGSTYGVIQRPGLGYQAIARYSAPGGAFSDLIFRDGFD